MPNQQIVNMLQATDSAFLSARSRKAGDSSTGMMVPYLTWRQEGPLLKKLLFKGVPHQKTTKGTIWVLPIFIDKLAKIGGIKNTFAVRDDL